jgi:hypothetical protein
MSKKMQRRSIEGNPREGEETLGLTVLDTLTSQARSAEDHEAYHLVAKQEDFRIGLVAIAAPNAPAALRVEVLLQVLAKNARPRIADLGRMKSILDILSKRGYSLEHHDSCWVLCERTVAADEVEEECEDVMAIIRSERDVGTRCEEV